MTLQLTHMNGRSESKAATREGAATGQKQSFADLEVIGQGYAVGQAGDAALDVVQPTPQPRPGRRSNSNSSQYSTFRCKGQLPHFAVDYAQKDLHGFSAGSADQIVTLGNTCAGKSNCTPD